MAHRNTYVLQSTIAHSSHMIEGFIRGLSARRPALFNLYSSCQPEHGIGDDMSRRQAKLAVESRAYPLFRYDPDAGTTFTETGQHISSTERRASIAERNAMDRYTASFLADRVGDTFTGTIRGVARFGLFVSLSDNILKPLLLGRGVQIPALVILLGAIGGAIYAGVIGLFLGAVVLALAYKLLIVWMDPGSVDEAMQAETAGE